MSLNCGHVYCQVNNVNYYISNGVCHKNFIAKTCKCSYCFLLIHIQYCLERWKKDCKKNNKPYTCPNCRSKITNSVRSIHLDNLIAAIFRDANDEVKKDREELIKDRQGKS